MNARQYAVLFALMSILGCQRQPGASDRPDDAWPTRAKVSHFSSAVHSLAREGETFRSEHVIALLGKPDRTRSIQEFAVLCEPIEKVVGGLNEPLMDRVYEEYREVRGWLGDVDRPWSWEESEGFRGCEVWLYRWPTPEVYVDYPLDPDGVVTSYSYFYFVLVRDDRIFGAGEICRRKWLGKAQKVIDQRTEPLALREFEAVFGQPEYQFDVRALTGKPSGSRHWVDFPARHAYRAYKAALAKLGEAPPDVNWQECEDFMGCRLLLYHWDRPETIWEEQDGWRQSYVFLVRDGVILGGATIVR
jgi:hypothetical protein